MAKQDALDCVEVKKVSTRYADEEIKPCEPCDEMIDDQPVGQMQADELEPSCEMTYEQPQIAEMSFDQQPPSHEVKNVQPEVAQVQPVVKPSMNDILQEVASLAGQVAQMGVNVSEVVKPFEPPPV